MKRLLKHPLVGRLKKAYRNACIAANYMAGIPDYDRYVAQQRKHNPNAPVMTRSQFVDYCRIKSNGRYDSKPRTEQAVRGFCCRIVPIYDTV